MHHVYQTDSDSTGQTNEVGYGLFRYSNATSFVCPVLSESDAG